MKGRSAASFVNVFIIGVVILCVVIYLWRYTLERRRAMSTIETCALDKFAPLCATNIANALYPQTAYAWEVAKTIFFTAIFCLLVAKASNIMDVFKAGTAMERCILDTSDTTLQ